MPFNTALSGIRAANTDLQVTGNNIANASTTGFKSSRAEFGDVYAGTILGSGSNSPGSGVNLQAIRQQFSQGNRNFTYSDLDLAVNGEGFFVISDGGNRLYTRAGEFGLNDDGYIVNNTGGTLQGFAADARGNLSGTLSNLRVDVSTQTPRQTTEAMGSFNLDANESVLETVGTSFATDGAAIGVPHYGLSEDTTTTMTTGSVPTPLNFGTDPTSFEITLAGSTPPSGNGTVTVTLDTSSANSMQDIANLINSAIYGDDAPINVQAVINNGNLEFRDLTAGVNSEITLGSVTGTNDLSTMLNGAPASVGGVAAVNNGYLAQTIEINGRDGSTLTFTSEHGASAAQSAAELNALGGVTASARTDARIVAGSFDNSLSTSSLASIRAEVNTAGDLEIVSQVGGDLRFGFSGSQPAGTVEVAGRTGTGTQTVNSRDNTAVIGGQISLVLSEGYSVASASPQVGNLFAPMTDASFTAVPINAFDPDLPSTYNHATTSAIFDSLGNAHTLEQYFVRQPYDPSDASTSPNHWVMYVQVDGQNVGDPDTTLPAPQNMQPTMASFNVHFNRDGSLNEMLSDSMLISNWTPGGPDGVAAGALQPLNVLQGGQLPVQDPPTSSNFEIDLSGTTQFGAQFAVESQDQDGHTSGRLSGLDIAEDGIIFARFTNGEAQVLGQVALANFNNVQGLNPVGGTMWAQTAATGEAVIGGPGTASLGSITAGALEESNVDLSEQLVNLIIAQRNFQASSKTIETANQTTQTIINLR